ncbi:MAG TPA: hypothetical protein VFM88_15025 [Vicinamibacteria bacterium]|nr:hypothetical protein [Vicinamibacteria bacterium]
MNELLRVPMVEETAEVECADGRRFTGRIFIPATSPVHDGPTRTEEWINEAAAFFPFLTEGGDAVLLNKREVLVLSVTGPAEARTPDEIAESPVRHVKVEAESRRLEGDLVLDMPEHHLRVLDYLNRAEAFLALREGAVLHLIQKERITRVIEVREE